LLLLSFLRFPVPHGLPALVVAAVPPPMMSHPAGTATMVASAAATRRASPRGDAAFLTVSSASLPAAARCGSPVMGRRASTTSLSVEGLLNRSEGYRQVCRCGTTVLFPGAMAERTCWKCGVSLIRSPVAPFAMQRDASSASTAPPRLPPPSTMPDAGLFSHRERAMGAAMFSASYPNEQQRRLHRSRSPDAELRWQQGSRGHSSSSSSSGGIGGGGNGGGGGLAASAVAVDAEGRPLSSSSRHGRSRGPLKDPSSGGYFEHWLVRVLLLSSLATNAALVLLWHGGVAAWLGGPSVAAVGSSGPEGLTTDASTATDTDGDGVPDHHDFCPGRCTERDASCGNLDSQAGWLSGRATDFDGDGCKDGVEDKDLDNDGVKDSEDRCPFTPQWYSFVSNPVSDFDGDGCADGFEDGDDDDDDIANTFDDCPRTDPSDSSDPSGCSRRQHEKARARAKAPTSAPGSSRPVGQQADPQADAQQADAKSPLPEWADTLKSAWVEVILGAGLTWLMHQVQKAVETVQQQLPATPSGSMRRLSVLTMAAGSKSWPVIRAVLVKAVGYFVFFVIVYQHRKKSS